MKKFIFHMSPYPLIRDLLYIIFRNMDLQVKDVI